MRVGRTIAGAIALVEAETAAREAADIAEAAARAAADIAEAAARAAADLILTNGKLDLAGGTMSGPLNMGSQVITNMGNITMVKNSGIQMLAALADDGDWCGETVIATAGEGIDQWDIVYLEDVNGVFKANATTDAKMPVKGIAIAGVASGDPGVFLIEGFIRRNAWGWTIGDFLYAHTTDGLIIATPPGASNNMVQRIGIAVTPFVIWFRPDLTMIKVE